MLKIDVSDIFLFVGICLLIAGCYLVTMPLALIVAGVLFIAYAAILERAKCLQANVQKPEQRA
jgi:uncharacterized membrane protein HdeD (DUF308 family)